MLHAQVCALERLHTLTLVARPKTAPRRQGLPLRAYVPRSCVCTSVPTHLESRSISERTGVCTSAPTRLDSRSASEDHATTATTACPCERISHGKVCARQRLHALTLVARPKTTPRRQRRLAPASVYPTVRCVHVSAYTPLLARLAPARLPCNTPKARRARGK
jgi:hypothetical protein